MSNRLDLRLFGPPRITWQDETVTGFVSNKARALLIYLVCTHCAHSRDTLAELLWADTPATAKSNLRRALSNLRNLNGITFREDSSQLVALDLDQCWVDVIEFEQLAHGAAAGDDIEALARAAQLYHADFLAGFNLSLSYEFEAWALGEQMRLKLQMVEVLRRLADGYAQRNHLPQAIATVRHLLQLESWREEAHRQLMELLALNNDVGAALTHFETCRQRLRAELDVEPSAATLELVAQIRAGVFPGNQPLHTGLPPSQRSVRAVAHPQVATTVEFQLVGRAHEWQLVLALWQGLAQPHFLCISGEAGIGKTRLAEELLLLAEQAGAPVARTRSHALQGQLVYGPITDWLRAAPFQAALAQLGEVWLTEVARLLPELLIDRPDLPPPPPLRESWQRKPFFDALCYAFASVKGPSLLLLDDLQWSDADTLEWLQYLVESVENRLLVLGTVRTDEIDADHPLHRIRQQLQRHHKFTELALASLDQDATAELATQVNAQALAGELAERLFHDTVGNPLFVIESMRATPAHGDIVSLTLHPDQTRGHDQLAMPAKIYSVIQARLAQLSPQAQTLAQLGATIGRAFDVTLLAKAADRDEEAVLLTLDELWQRRVIREVDASHFDFSHDCIRDVTYGEISPVKRRLLHRKVANALEMIHGENLDAVCGHLAVHCETAGLLEQAIAYYRRAADGARQLFAHQEAANNHQKALRVLRQLHSSVKNKQNEIDLLLELTNDRKSANGIGSPSAGKALLEAYELAQTVGTPVQQCKTLIELMGHYRVRGQWSISQEFIPQALAAAGKTGDQFLIDEIKLSSAYNYMHLGNLEKAHSFFEQLQAPGNVPVYRPTRFGHFLWLLGFPDQARQQASRALRFGRETAHAGLPMIMHLTTMLLVFCRDLPAADVLSIEAIESATKRNDHFCLRCGNIYHGWLIAQQGRPDEGIALIRKNADEHGARGHRIYECFWRSLLIEAYLLASEFDRALVEIDNTLAYAHESGNCYWNAQLLKLRGDCLQACNASDAAIEHQYQLGSDTARTQSARSLELRATISLCRLWQKQGKIAEAYELLADIYGWFTEGFDTGDLVEAKALLAELRLGSSI